MNSCNHKNYDIDYKVVIDYNIVKTKPKYRNKYLNAYKFNNTDRYIYVKSMELSGNSILYLIYDIDEKRYCVLKIILRNIYINFDKLNEINNKDVNDDEPVTKLYKYEHVDRLVFFYMPYYGISLCYFIDRRIYFNDYEKMYIIKNIIKGLIYLHDEVNVLHGDVKPDNVFVLLDNSDTINSVRLGDLDSVYTLEEINLRNLEITTITYRSPEFFMKKSIDYNYDTWSLGCIIFELYTFKQFVNINDIHGVINLGKSIHDEKYANKYVNSKMVELLSYKVKDINNYTFSEGIKKLLSHTLVIDSNKRLPLNSILYNMINGKYTDV